MTDQRPSKTDADIYADVGKRRWPYVDEPRPVPPTKKRPGGAAEAVEPRPGPHPLVDGGVVDAA